MSYISEASRQKIASQANHRCEYCQASQKYVFARLEIDHIIPVALGGTDEDENLCLACRLCNSYKQARTEGMDSETGAVVSLFHPRRDTWSNHFQWNGDGQYIIGKTPCGRVTVDILQLNNELAVDVRRAWVSVGWHPPK